MTKIVRTLLMCLPLLVLLSPQTSGSECADEGTQCRNGYCSGSYPFQPYPFQPSCVDGYCRCFNTAKRDPCTCLAVVGSCHIQRDASNAVGTPTTRGSSETTYSCVTNDTNCNYEVHVISNYESSNGRHGFGITRTRGDTTVNLEVNGQSSKPLILVFVTYEPVNWRLQIPGGVVIEKILLSSFYIDATDVTFPVGRVLDIERVDRSSLPYGYGSDTGGGNTVQLLQYVNSRFGPVASFSGCYRADSWTLNFTRQPPPQPGMSESNGYCWRMAMESINKSCVSTSPSTSTESDIQSTQPNSESGNVGLAVGLSVFAGVVLIFYAIPCVICTFIAMKSRRASRTPVVRTVTSSDPTTSTATRVSSSSATTDRQWSASLSQNNQFPTQPPAPEPATIPPDTACTRHGKDGVFIAEPPPPYAAAVNYPKPQFVYPSYLPSDLPPSYPG